MPSQWSMKKQSLVNFNNFIVATRDSGYKSTASALAELVDNSIEAKATMVQIYIRKTQEIGLEEYEIILVDNGHGMLENELNVALQFGGSTRFNARGQLGRYGMGLPNSSLSQCKRVEVITWKNKSEVLGNYLDIDEIVENNWSHLRAAKYFSSSPFPIITESGTIVVWKKCDRLSFKYVKSLIKFIKLELGRIFRYAIWRGVEIKIDDEKVAAFDPLFMGKGLNLVGGELYGKDLHYRVKVPGNEHKTSDVRVRFVELPENRWSKLTNEEKRKNQITKCAGASILRSEREIDYGWFFFGDKRKENYDDWWRCEIAFTPELDEAFGVTHTKQEIKETEFMRSILVPDLEQTARALNNRVRLGFIELRKQKPSMYSKGQLERNDVYQPAVNTSRIKLNNLPSTSISKGFQYEIITKALDHDVFFDIEQAQDKLILVINTTHLFYDKIFKALHDKKIKNVSELIKVVELLIFAAGRSELSFTNRKESKAISAFKKEWSSQLKTFIS
jgi:hypothetical protein